MILIGVRIQYFFDRPTKLEQQGVIGAFDKRTIIELSGCP